MGFGRTNLDERVLLLVLGGSAIFIGSCAMWLSYPGTFPSDTSVWVYTPGTYQRPLSESNILAWVLGGSLVCSAVVFAISLDCSCSSNSTSYVNHDDGLQQRSSGLVAVDEFGTGGDLPSGEPSMFITSLGG